MGKYQESLMQEVKKRKEKEVEQKELKEKYNIQEEDVLIVEKSNWLKFFLGVLAGILEKGCMILILILAAIGLIACLYPQSRETLLLIMKDIQRQVVQFLQ